ncbi:hypothetical protein AGMMS49992_20290 [Clostridia bacterium]|nr:hypothetical protein AGMMS49992_20290 [Clostridia bacterium]
MGAAAGAVKSVKNATVYDVYFIGKLDKGIYEKSGNVLRKDDIVITEERIVHIGIKHANDWEKYGSLIQDALDNPDNVLLDDNPYTVIVLKQIPPAEMGNVLRITVRLWAEGDKQHYTNSVLTFQRIKEKEARRLVRNKPVVYKRE